jgi:biopolymer transport protein ExbD
MPQVKVKRKSVSLDMTAMCDVAFLLLTFFMLTTKFKSDEPVVVDTPSSISAIPIPDTDILMISIDKAGKIFFGVDRQRTRIGMLKAMGEKKGVQFTDQETAIFSNTTTFGVPTVQLKQFLDMEKSARNKLAQPGISADSANNELKEWIYAARRANQDAYSKPLKIAIKGDQDSNAPIVRRVIASLQEQEINKFNFITDLEALPDFLQGKKK